MCTIHAISTCSSPAVWPIADVSVSKYSRTLFHWLLNSPTKSGSKRQVTFQSKFNATVGH